MSEANTQTSPNLTTTASANDAVFSEISRKEVLSILKGRHHSLVGTLMQPFQNAVSGWLGVEFGPSTADWSKTVEARTLYHTSIMDQLPPSQSSKDPKFEQLRTGTHG